MQDPDDDPTELPQGQVAIAPDISSIDEAEDVARGPARDQPQQVTGGAVSEDWVVWNETPSIDLVVDPWVMYAYDRHKQVTRQLSRAPKLTNGVSASPPGWTAPVLTGNRVGWAEVVGEASAPQTRIVGCVIQDCHRPDVILPGAAYPSATTTGIYGLATAEYAGERKPPGPQSYRVLLRRHNAQKVEVTHRFEVAKGERLSGFKAIDNIVAWTIEGKQKTSITIVRNGRTTTISGSGDMGFGYPVVTDRYVAWAEAKGGANVGGYLYHFESSKLYELGNTRGLYGVEGAGDYIAWQETRPPGDLEGIEFVIAEVP